jgi:glucosamine-6-phosphate deaminase
MQNPEKITTVISDDPDTLSVHVADRIESVMQAATRDGRRAILGLATGSTPIGVYRELIRRHRTRGLSFANVETFNLDEYWPMTPDSIHSYHRFMWENFFSHIDIPPAQVHLPPGAVDRHEIAAACAAYEAAIVTAGGIDFQLLGIGKTGHIGFNEPGSGRESRTRLVVLDAITRKDAAADFFGAENVPREAITMGVATILDAREIAILATGEHKSAIVRRAVEGVVDLEVAATFLQAHPNTTFFLDAAASVELTRIATPWLVDEVSWTPDLAVRAVAWLSKTVGKAILKLTQHDYAEHRLSSLVAVHGSPGAINGFVFNSLGARIRGKSKLHRGKRVICFSPHPDDDVISMGGILRKLVENRNSIAVAYMTSGNIAVFDHDVRRHLDFLVRMGARTHEETTPTTLRGEDVRDVAFRLFGQLAGKRPGEVDVPAVQDIKRIIRETEAVSGLEVVGLTRDNARFLDLPFYQTGKVRKDPIGPADVRIVRDLLEEVHPEVVFVAGDLSDPHGTHRMCKEAIDAALEEYVARGNARPEVWLYRGAWQEWPVTEASVLVPLSQEELRLKIQAIFKHQSQKDSAPFPGQDDREFWQRVQDRNTETAAQLNRLGLAEYFAMEAYVVA